MTTWIKNTIFVFIKNIVLKAIEHFEAFETILLNLPLDECKIKRNYKWYIFFYVATAIGAVVYSKKVTTNVTSFSKYERYFLERLLRHAQTR